MAEGVFATAINCMDGRTQEPVIALMKEKYGADYIDTVTEPGPIKILDEKSPTALVDSIRNRVTLSSQLHASKAVGIVAHHDCGGNPVGKERQMEQLESAISHVESWGLGLEVIGIWVDENWAASVVS